MLKTRGMVKGREMVKGMLLIHIGVVSSLGHVASSPFSHMSSSPLRCCHVSYPGCVVVSHRCCLIVVFAGVVVTLSLSSSCVLVMLFFCRGLLILCLSGLSCHHPCPSCIIVVPRCWSVVMLCVSKVGWDEQGGVLTGVHVFVFGCSSLSGVVLVVIVACDVALPRRCWLCAVVVGGWWQQWAAGCWGWWWCGGVVTGVMDGGWKQEVVVDRWCQIKCQNLPASFLGKWSASWYIQHKIYVCR